MSTKKVSRKPEPDEMRREYDLRGGVRGKYFAEYEKGTNLVLLAPDVAKSFPDSDAVNQALRKVISEKRVTESGRSGERANSRMQRTSARRKS